MGKLNKRIIEIIRCWFGKKQIVKLIRLSLRCPFATLGHHGPTFATL